MDRNAFLAFALSFLVLSLWMTWEAKNRPHGADGQPVLEQPAPQPEAAETVPPPLPGSPPEPAVPAAVPPAPTELVPEQLVEIESELFHAVLTSKGAGIRRFELRRYSVPESEGGGPVVMIDRGAEQAPAFAAPLAELGLGDLGRASFRVQESTPTAVTFEYTHNGVTVRKTFEFEPGRYAFQLRLEVRNDGSAAPAPAFGVELPESARSGSDFRELTLAALVQGSVEREPVASFGRAGFFGGEPKTEQQFAGDVTWAGAYSHYFLEGVIPDVARDAQVAWRATTPGEEALVTVSHPPVTVPPGNAVTRAYTIYVGPKIPERLEAVGSQLDRSIDLGWAWIAPLTRAFIWMLHALHAVIPNYGVAIIVLTILVRLVTAPLAAKQMKSMKRMGELGPKIKELQEKYKDDRQAQSQEMMKLYREAGVNPLGGCLPMVLQIPVFIGLYYALRSSIDLRQAPFLLWINDLSQPETLFTLPGVGWPVRVLPVLMTLSMVLQQRMTPTASMDPAQQRMMMVLMPVMFFFMFYGFPSGLVLYWFVSNLLAIAQQMYLNRQVGARPA